MKKVFCVILLLNPDAHLINTAIPGVTKSWIQQINHELSLPLAFLTLALPASVQDLFPFATKLWSAAFVTKLSWEHLTLLLGTVKCPRHDSLVPMPFGNYKCFCLVLAVTGMSLLHWQEHFSVGQPGKTKLHFFLVCSSVAAHPARLWDSVALTESSQLCWSKRWGRSQLPDLPGEAV